MNEIEAIFIAAELLIQMEEDTGNRVLYHSAGLSEAERIISDIESKKLLLVKKLKELGSRLGYIDEKNINSYQDLPELLDSVRESHLEQRNKMLPANVIEFPKKAIDISIKETKALYTEETNVNGALKEAVFEALNSVTDQERDVICNIFGIDTEDGKELVGQQVYLQRYVGEKLGMSQQNISRIYRKAMRKLRHPSRSEEIIKYYNQLIKSNSDVSSREENFLYHLFS